VAAVVGSGIAAQRLSPNDTGLQLLENAVATGAALVAVILAVGAVSGAHLNPVVSAVDAAFGGLRRAELAAYVAAQIAGGILGAIVANLMFSLDAVSISRHTRGGGGLWFSEAVATFGLLLVVFGIARAKRAAVAPFAVGAYITGAYFFTSSTSFANPAVTVSRMLSDTFAGIAPGSVAAFVAAQLAGGAVAYLVVRLLWPDAAATAAEVVVPHDAAAAAAEESTRAVQRHRLPRALFVCVHNAGRSQIAEALWERAGGEARSAGSAPADRVHPEVVEAMRELGIDLEGHTPRALTAADAGWAELVVTMGCGDACPYIPGRRYLDWELDDPRGRSLDAVRAVRDEIASRVQELVTTTAETG
jgi:arsenate reductase